jgi:hypothetical protein
MLNFRILAIMLGRLRMTIDECEAAYLKLSEKIFNHKRAAGNLWGRSKDFLQANRRFDSKVLEASIKETITSHNFQENELLQDLEPRCNV